MKMHRHTPAVVSVACSAACISAASGQIAPPRLLSLRPSSPAPLTIAPATPGWISPAPLPQDAPLRVCYAEGTSWDYVRAVDTMVWLRTQIALGIYTDYYVGGRWSGTPGTTRSLTWSFVPDGLIISGGANEPASASNLFARMDTAYASQGGRATWINRFQQVFDRWHALTGLSFTRVRSGANDWDDGAAWGSGGAASRGDLRISMHNIDGGNRILAYTYFPSNGDMVIDSADVTSNNFASTGNQNRFLRNVVAHEEGHAFGMNHVCPANHTKLMEPFISLAYDGPRQDDIRGVQSLYGDPAENNSSAATAYPLGALSSGSPLTLGALPTGVSGSNDPNAALLTIEGTGRADYYSFTIGAPLVVTVVAMPVGSNYDSSVQAGNGSCTSGNFTNALAAGNLTVTLYDHNGTSVLGTADFSAAGVAETLASVPVASAGTYFIKVACSNTMSSVQSYRLSVSGSGGSACPAFPQQPISQSACDGSSAELSVSVTGAPAPSLQWRKNMMPLSDGGNISGATTTTLTINPVGPGDAGSYDVVAINTCGSTTSTPAVFTVNNAPGISVQPESQTVPLGTMVTFTVASPNGDAFQWRKDHQLIPGETGVSYVIPSAQLSDQGAYDCLISNECGISTSDPATLTIGTACYPNCDGSTAEPILNVNDFICFQGHFAAGDPYANCDGSTAEPVLNVNDFICFQGQFAAGCP